MVNIELQTHYKMSVLYLVIIYVCKTCLEPDHTQNFIQRCSDVTSIFLDNLCLYTFTDGASGSQNHKNLSKEKERADMFHIYRSSGFPLLPVFVLI